MSMSGQHVNVSKPNPAVLERFFNGPRAPVSAMPLTTLDGFLTAIAACPGLVLPSEWLDVVWGEDGPEFESLDEANAVVGAIMARYNEIIAQNDPSLGLDAGSFAPRLDPSRDNLAEAKLWAEGFVACMGSFGDAWQPLLARDDTWPLIMPFMMLADPERSREFFEDEKPIPRKELEKAFEMAPALVKTMFLARRMLQEERADLGPRRRGARRAAEKRTAGGGGRKTTSKSRGGPRKSAK